MALTYARVNTPRLSSGPEAVAEQVLKALGSAQPAARYPAGRGARFVVAARRLLPDRVMDAAVRRLFTP